MSCAMQRIRRERDFRCSAATEGTARAIGSDQDTDGGALGVLLRDHRRWSVVNCVVDTKQATVDSEETIVVPVCRTISIDTPK